MSRPTIYVETTIFGYLASRPSKNPLIREHQRLTGIWWRERRGDFDLFISPQVDDEIGAGDPEAAEERRVYSAGLPVLDETFEVKTIAAQLLRLQIIPEKAKPDAVHIACAAVHRMNFLLTWNCRHLANSEILPRVKTLLDRFGLATPMICTPLTLMGDVEP